jgi:N-acyl-phosphatidylethanolamine-hydrolysing phospholipase D
MHRLTRRLVAGALPCLVAGGAAQVTAPDRPAHHRDGGFQNNYAEIVPKGLATVLRWRWDSYRAGLPPPPAAPVPTVAPDLAFLQANARAGTAMEPAVTWIGHASALVQLGGLNVLTDPIFSERASPLSFVGPRRAQPPGLTLAQLPRIDVVLISHNHYDHLDEASVVALARQAGGPPLFLVPLGNKAWFEDLGIRNVRELDWWQSHAVGGTEFVFTPVQHWSARGLNDRMKTLWGGWAAFAPDCHLFFSGDTGYSKDFADFRQRFADRQGGGGFDLALIALGGYEPRWFMKDQHVNPDETVQIHRDLAARHSIGIHWGTFELTDEALDEAPKALAAALQRQSVARDAVVVLAIGETRKITPRTR